MAGDRMLTPRDARARRAALRDGVLACGRRIGWSAHTTVAFTEGLARCHWKRCSQAQLAAVLDELQATLRTLAARGDAAASVGTGRGGGRDRHAPRA